MQLILINLLHPLFQCQCFISELTIAPKFDTGSSFLLKIHIIFYCQYEKFLNAAYEEAHLHLLQSFLKIKLKGRSHFFKIFVDKFCSPPFLYFQSFQLIILRKSKNVSNMLCLIVKILIQEKFDITRYLLR